jgi:hypothetical protein
MIVQPWSATIPLSNHRPLKGILLGVNVRGMLRAKRNAHAFQHVHLEKPRKQFLHVHSLFCQCPDVKDSWRKLATQSREQLSKGESVIFSVGKR